ncbi:VOC family protein [Adhaeribacter soli]|uniref:VOC family protein n=1 Tax=Adhaeribacter soli TaxID=2607655 RepID=A0A5N1J1H8_9BACT|nr:VOC family protein [Adhaeribacter soli]KAA9340643.1 VOC family protein [Adhaeribacter soli]
MKTNYINWFEIPVSDMDRASKFYNTVFGIEVQTMPYGEDQEMGIFAHSQDTGVAGALVKGQGYEPSAKGPLLYLNGGEDLSNALAKVEAAGGSVVMEKFQISPENGYMAIFIDTEGNKLAMHSMN